MKRSYEEIRSCYEKWLNAPGMEPSLREELAAYDDETMQERFISDLNFGTAGLRGVMAAGTNAMNIYTVMQATQGFAQYILDQNGQERGVAIACDSRINSALFARKCAEVLAANGVRAYLFDDLRPTPELSFAIRALNCIAGINITASHNPKQYNGYKAYWEDGAQLGPEQADAVSACIRACDIFTGVKTMEYDRALADGMITLLGEEMDERYMAAVLNERVNPMAIADAADDYRVVYTPLHGAGLRLVPEVLKRSGVKHLYTVEQQMIPDGSFPTTAKPNPEYPAVFGLGIKLAEEVHSDLIIANDPDCDRTGVMAKGADGQFTTITGNQMGCLLLDYIITAYQNTGSLPNGAYAVKTIVSSELAARICSVNGVKLFDVLTGFKYIGEVIKNHEGTDSAFLLGFEESYGYLKGTYARDKDGVVAAMLIAEMGAYYKKQNMTLADALTALYEKYGWYAEKTDEIYMEGLDGLDRMNALMEKLRHNPPAQAAGRPVAFVRDYLAGTVRDTRTGAVEDTGLPRSNVLYFETDDRNMVIIRPSGTEPKIKIYFLTHGDNREHSAETLAAFCAEAASWMK